ncbi:MAG: metal ABC transporter ATP-binding protein [bacterium]
MNGSGSIRSCGECCTRLVDFGVTLRGRSVLEGIGLHMHCGELTSLIGPNGAGKTTLLRAMVGELPHTGTLRFIHRGSIENTTPLRIGYVPQKLELDRTSPTTVLDLFAGALTRWPLWVGTRKAVRNEALEKLALVDAEALLTRRISEISVGQLQRVLLALALSPIPELLLLDEPVAALDQGGMERFYQTVSQMRTEYDLSILLVSHDLTSAAQFADRMILLNRTVLCDGPPREVLLNPLIRQTFGFGFTEQEIAGRRPVPRELEHEQCALPMEGAL